MSYEKNKAYWDKHGGRAAYEAEVKRKAQAGIALSDPTSDSKKLYSQYQKPSSGTQTTSTTTPIKKPASPATKPSTSPTTTGTYNSNTGATTTTTSKPPSSSSSSSPSSSSSKSGSKLNMANELAYLRKLASSGNPGLKTWAENRAKSLGLNLSQRISTSTDPGNKFRNHTYQPNPNIAGTGYQPNQNIATGGLPDTTGASKATAYNQGDSEFSGVYEIRDGQYVPLTNTEAYASDSSHALNKSREKLVHDALQSGDWSDFYKFDAKQNPFFYNDDGQQNRWYWANRISTDQVMLQKALTSGDATPDDIARLKSKLEESKQKFMNAPTQDDGQRKVDEKFWEDPTYNPNAPKIHWIQGHGDRTQWENPIFQDRPDLLDKTIKAREGAGRSGTLPSWYIDGYSSPQEYQQATQQPMFGMPGQLSPGQGQQGQGGGQFQNNDKLNGRVGQIGIGNFMRDQINQNNGVQQGGGQGQQDMFGGFMKNHNAMNGMGGMQNPTSRLDTMMNTFQNLVGGLNNPNSTWQQGLQEQAIEQAEKAAEEKRNSLKSLVNKLKTNQEVGLKEIQDSIANAKQGMDNDYFQKYLQARQGMSDRGLSGSGLARDADTRLMLQKQNDMAGMYRDASSRQFRLNSQYGNKLDDVNTQLSNINVDDMASQKFQDLYKTNGDMRLQQAKLYQDYLKNLMGYDIDGRGLDFKYDELGSEERRFYDNLNSEERRFYDNLSSEERRFYENLGSEERRFYEKLGSEEQRDFARIQLDKIEGDRRYSTDLTKETGYLVGTDGQYITDESGNRVPILDRDKFDETVRRNKELESINWAEVDLRGDELIAKMTQWIEENKMSAHKIDLDEREFAFKQEQAKDMISKAASETNNPQTKNLITAYRDQLNDISGELNAYIRQGMHDQPEYKEAARRYDQVLEKLHNTILNSDFNVGKGGGETGGNYSYNKLWKTKSMGGMASAKYESTAGTIKKALRDKGLDTEWLPYVMELTARESSWNPTAQNPKSTAYGLFQFLDATWKNYGHKKTSDPYKQALAGLDYIKKRYGTPQKALEFWDKNKWY